MKPGLNLNNEKYSNVDIFAKRMKDRIKLHSAYHSNHIKSFHSMNKSKNPFDLTLSTFASTKRTIFSARRNKKKNNDFNKMIQYNSDINLNNKLFLTDTLFLENKITSQSNKSILGKKDDIYYSPIYKKSPNYLLYLFEKDKNDFIESKYKIRNPKLSNKIYQYHNKKEKVRDYMNKTRNLKLLKYSITTQKDRNSTYKEVHNNQLEKLNGLITSYNQSKKLFNEEFLNKFNEYVKRIITRREIERGKNEQLIEQIFQYKNDIAIIESKIRKVEFEKNNIIKWIYFQICLNEQILNVPFYYKVIIEEPEEDFNNFINEEKKEKINESNLNTPILTRNNSKSNSFKKEFHYQITRRKEKTESKKTNNSNNKITSEKSIKMKYNLNSLLKKITKEEIKRIRDYRYSIIFGNVDDFIFQFNQLENKNLNHISEYNILSKQLFQLKKEQNSMEIEWKKEMDYILKGINIKEKELKLIIEKNVMLLKEVKHFKKISKKSMIYSSKKKNNKLFNSILNLYNVCNKINYVFEEKKRPTLTIEEEMIEYLKKIEIYLDYLDSKYKIYNNQNDIYYDELIKLQNDAEKQHKLEKTQKQREELSQRFEKLKEKIEKRNNKVYYLPKKKYEKYSGIVNKKEKKQIIKKEDIKEPIFEDFISDS